MKELNEATGKKVVLYAHSFGNFQTLNFLYSLTQAEKDQYIARYFAIAPPFGGAVKPVVSLLGMDSSYSYELVIAKVGLTVDFFEQAVFTFKGLFNLFPQDHFTAHRSRPYIQAMLKKIEAEGQGKDPEKGTIFDVFPPISSQCAVGFTGRPDNCVFGLHDFNDFGRIKSERITPGNLESILRKHSHSEYSADVYKQSLDPRFLELKNPGVQVNLIFGAGVETHKSIEYYEDPKVWTKDGKIYDPNKVFMGAGDGSVLATSALLAGVKWEMNL